MNIEIKITADSVEEARAAFAKLAGERPATHITVIPSDPRVEGGELAIPAGTDMKVAEVTRDSVTLTSDPTQEPMQMPEPEPAPEKPKRARKAAKAPESAKEAAGEPEAPQAATTPAEPEKPAEKPAEAPELGAPQYGNPVPTKEQIGAAGAKMLDDNPGIMPKLLALLDEYGVQAIMQLKDDQLPGFAEKLRALGAEV